MMAPDWLGEVNWGGGFRSVRDDTRGGGRER